MEQNTPTLSTSSKRNYRQQDDIDNNINSDVTLLKRKLYGRRYKIASNIYLRLLTRLEERMEDGRRDAVEFVADDAARCAAVILEVLKGGGIWL